MRSPPQPSPCTILYNVDSTFPLTLNQRVKKDRSNGDSAPTLDLSDRVRTRFYEPRAAASQAGDHRPSSGDLTSARNRKPSAGSPLRRGRGRAALDAPQIALLSNPPTGLPMSNRSRSQNGRRSKDDLLTQREYADALSVSSGYVSKRTRNDGLLIKDRFDPFLDARFENGDPENGDLLGYTDPTDRSTSNGSTTNGEVSPESARKAAGISSGGGDTRYGKGNQDNGQVRENPSGRTQPTGPSQSGGRSREGSGLEEALERAGDVAGREVAKSPGALRGVMLIGGAALGAILASKLVERGAGPVLLGTVIGFSITEYAIRAEETRPPEPTRQIRPTGLRRPVTYNLPPGMDQGGNQRQMHSQPAVEKERLASGRSGAR